MFIADTKAFWLNILWIILFLSTTCVGESLNITDTIITTNTTIMTTSTPLNVPAGPPRHTVVLCQCHSGEVMDDTGQCQFWANGTLVPTTASRTVSESTPVDTKELSVIVNETRCEHRQVDLQEDQIVLRLRGDSTDLLVTKGALQGLQVSNYCIHHQQVGDLVNVTARGCVSVPVIPRCCPLGEHWINGDCVPSTRMYMPFNPPLTTGPYGKRETLPWTDHQDYVNKPICTTGYVLNKIKLDGQKAYLAVLPDSVWLYWHPEGSRRQNSKPPQYCVDAPDDGIYYAHTCQKECTNNTCTNKCCPRGQALSASSRGCVPNDLPFKPAFPSPRRSLTTFYGQPKCGLQLISNFRLFENGTLTVKNITYDLYEFCSDTFIDQTSNSSRALICRTKEIITLNITDPNVDTYWHIVRKDLFPYLHGLSCSFLALLIYIHAWVPKLREQEGKYHLCHAVSLFLGQSILAVTGYLIPRGFHFTSSCISLGLITQFSYLSAFFWLNIICFDVWRLSRNLVKNKSSPESCMLAWIYMVYAFGGPLTITVITIIAQLEDPKEGSNSWLIHPHIGESNCWFKGDLGLLPYFYGPIAISLLLNSVIMGITYHYIKILRKDDHTFDDDDSRGNTNDSAETSRRSDYFSGFQQHFYLLVLVTVSWFTELLSWKIPPEELWALTDCLNNIQGVFIFGIFLSHHKKRSLLLEKLPVLLGFANMMIKHTNEAQGNINKNNELLYKIFTRSKNSSQTQEVPELTNPNFQPGTPVPESHQTITFSEDRQSKPHQDDKIVSISYKAYSQDSVVDSVVSSELTT